jgi:putative membrane protein
MHSAKNYKLKEVILWTRRDIYAHTLIASLVTFIFTTLEWKWIAIPWLPIALMGTAVAFVVGFKNNASYDRLWEARRIWGAIVNASRSWGIMVQDYVTNQHAKSPLSENELNKIQRRLIDRHLAWLTALRYQLREPRVWESRFQVHNIEYRNRTYVVDEHSVPIDEAIADFVADDECAALQSKTNKAAQILALQSRHLRKLLEDGFIEDFRHMEMERIIVELYNQQGASERIKNFPYPRQFATLNLYFIKAFVFLIPFGMLQEFDKLGEHLIWLNIPFSVLSAWIFTTMEKIGEVTESPFEGSANDVPISAMSRGIEIDLKEMFDYEVIPEPVKPVNNILL